MSTVEEHNDFPNGQRLPSGVGSPRSDVSDNKASTARGIDQSRVMKSTRHARADGSLLGALDIVVHRLFYDCNENVVLASDQTNGGPETFSEDILFYLQIVRAPKAVRDSTTRHNCLEPDLLERHNGFCVTVTTHLRSVITTATIYYLQDHPGEIINVEIGPKRAPGAIPIEYRMTRTTVFCTSTEANCLRAAVANGISTYSLDDATDFLRSGPIPDENFNTLIPWMEEHCKGYQLQNCEYIPARPDEWVMHMDKGVFILIIHGINYKGAKVPHVVAIDAGAHRIIDSCEVNMLYFTRNALRECSVDCRYIGGVDIRRVYQVPRNTTHNTQREISIYD